MKYISKGIVKEGSTEFILHVLRGRFDFQLTGEKLVLWLNGRLGFAEADTEKNPILRNALEHLRRMGLVEIVENVDAGEYWALTRCMIVPAKEEGISFPLNSGEKRILHWLRKAGLNLTMAELVFLTEHGIEPSQKLLGRENRHRLTETIYTQDNIFDNILETQMERAKKRDDTVKMVLGLLKKQQILLL